MADIKERIVIESVDKTKKGYKSAQKNTATFNKSLNTLKTTMAALAGFFGLNILSGWIGRVASASDTVVELDAKVKLATNSTEEFNYVQQELVEISLDTNSALESNSVLFSRLNDSIKDLGGSTQSTLDLTELLSSGLKISGANTQRSAAFTEQFIQSMDSGVVRGDEFNSMMENGGRIMTALADGLGVAKGELRGMAEQGQLTAKLVNEALLSQFKTIKDEASQIPVTTARAWQNVITQYMVYLKDFKELNGTVAQGISLIAIHFTDIAGAIGVAAKVSAILYGAHLIKAARDKLVALKEERTSRMAAAEAAKIQAETAKTQQIAEKELAATTAQANALRTKFAAQEAAQSVQRHKQSILDAQDSIKRITLSEKELAQQVRQLKWEIRSNTAKKGTALATKQLIGLKHRHLLSVQALRLANESLIVSENKLTTAITVQSGAIRANSAAMTVSAGATAVAAGTVATASTLMTKASAGIGKASGFLLGIPGLLLYAAYELADAFLNMKVVFVGWETAYNKLLATSQYFWENIKSGGATDESLQRYQDKLAEIDQQQMLALDAILANEGKKQAAYEATQTQHVASSLKSIEQITAAEKAHQESQQAVIDSDTAIKKIALSQQFEDKAAYEAAVKELEIQGQAEKDQLVIDRLARESEAYTQYYNDQIARAGENQTKIIELELEKADHIKRISQETLDVLIANANKLVGVERTARARSKSVLKEYSDFVTKINGDQRTVYQKNADAYKTQQEIKSKLRQAEKAELEGNHKEAQRLSEEALKSAKELTVSQKERADSAAKGSLEEIRANADVKKSLAQVKDATDLVKTSSDSLAESTKADLDARMADINSYKDLIKQLDTQLNTKRSISADIETGAAFRAISVINSRINNLNQTVTVTIVEKTVKAKQSGGLIYRADGGFIPRKNKVPGSGSGDKVKAMLEPGEFIMRKSAVQKFGEKAMYALNAGKDIIKRKAGGMVNKVRQLASGGFVNSAPESTNVSGDIDVNLSEVSAQINEIDRSIKALNQQIDVDINKSDTLNQTDDINNGIDGLNQDVDVDITQNETYDQINDIDQRIKDLNQTVRVDIESDSSVNSPVNSYSESSSSSSSSSSSRGSGGIPKVDKYNTGVYDEDYKLYLTNRKQQLETHGVVSAAAMFRKPLTYKEWKAQLGAKWGSKKGYSTGGRVTGQGIGDTVDALLTPDEFVIQKPSVEKFGNDFFDSLNNGILPDEIINHRSGSNRSSPSQPAETINLNFNMGNAQAQGRFDKNEATMALIDELKQAGAGS